MINFEKDGTNNDQEVEGIFDKLSRFVNKSSDYLKKWASSNSPTNYSSDNPDDYLPYKNLKMIEQMMIQNPALVNYLLQLGDRLDFHDSQDMKKQLTKAYSQEMIDMIK